MKTCLDSVSTPWDIERVPGRRRQMCRANNIWKVGSKYDLDLFNLYSESFRNLPLLHLVARLRSTGKWCIRVEARSLQPLDCWHRARSKFQAGDGAHDEAVGGNGGDDDVVT